MKKVLISLAIIFNLANASAQVNTEHLLRVGGNALYFNDYILAIQYFNKIINARPYLEQAYMYRAFAKISLEDFEGALADLNTTISKNQFLPRAYYARGYVYNRLGEYAKAESDFSKALEFSPDDTGFLIGRLEAYDLQKKYREELADIDYILRKNGSKDPTIALEKGRVQLLLGDTVAAFGTMDSLIRQHDYLAAAWGGRALINMLMERNDSALADYNKAIALRTDNAVYYINRANLLHRKHNYRGAIADLDQALMLVPNDKMALFNRSLITFETGDYNRSIADLNRLVKLAPKMYEAKYQRAIINQKLGKHNEAIADLSKIIDRYPNFAPAYHLRAASYDKLRNRNASYRDMQAVIRLENSRKNRKHETPKDNEDLDSSIKIAQSRSGVSDWAKLFEMTDETTDNTFGNNSIRGNIQNRSAEATPQGDFVLTPYRRSNDIAAAQYFSAQLNELNTKHRNEMQLFFVSSEVSLTDALIAYHFKKTDEISERIQQNPNDYYNYFYRGINYSLVQDFDNAIKDFSAAIALRNDALAYFCRAEVRRKQLEVSMTGLNITDGSSKVETSAIVDKKLSHDSELLLRDYDAAIELAPDFAFAHYNKANVLAKLQDYNAAIAAYSRAIELNKNFAEAYFNRGLIYIYTGETHKGTIDLSKAGELGLYEAYNLIKRLR